jgi:glycosyltransferase involved in cell wall biosynthesis
MKKTLIIIPVYNEEVNIKKVIREIRQEIDFADILVIDDCSTDGTLKKIKSLDINFLSLPFNLGYSGVLQTGFKYAVEKNYEYVVQFDGDGQHIAAEVKKLNETSIEKNADIVIGSRFKDKKGSPYPYPLFRRIGSFIFKMLIKNICNTEITDPTSGFQMLKKNVFGRYARMYNYPQYPDANLIIEMLLNNYKIVEIPVAMRKREIGTSMHEGFIKPIKYMVKMFYSIVLIIIKYKLSF